MEPDSSAPIDRPAAEARFAALLKFDLVGSTEISKRLRRADEDFLLTEYRNTVNALVQGHQAKIEWQGDGGTITFGYPLVHVDASELAVRTGLLLVDRIRTLRLIPRLQLELRVGIASDRITVETVTGLFSSVQPFSRAERLMKHAGPGEVLVADDTRRLAKGFFEYEDRGVVDLQGFGNTRVWRVVRETAVVSRYAARRHDATPPPIVGRDADLAQLRDAWSSALAGHGKSVCIVGDAGIGKSRLAQAALETAARDGAVTWEIDCTPSSGNTPLLPFGVLLRRIAGIGAGASTEDKTAAALALLTPLLNDGARDSLLYLAPLLGIEQVPAPIDKTREQVRATTLSLLAEIVNAQAGTSPLLVLCEDLHWADDTTAQAIQGLAAAAGTQRLLLVATRWPVPVTPVNIDSVTQAFSVTINLDPLPSSNAGELVRTIAADGLPPERVTEIVNRCGGVPLLLEEVTRSTLERAATGEASPASASVDSAVPPELQLVVEARLERTPELRDIIEAASVLGREFPVALLEAMLPHRRSRVDEALARFTEQGLLALGARQEDGRASFRHALLRDAVYETLVSRDYLRRLHSRAADALVEGFRDTPDASPDVLAQHLHMAGRLDEAAGIRLSAAEHTFNRGAYVEALGHCDAVQALLEESLDPHRTRPGAFRLHVLRGMVGTGIHGYSAATAEAAYRCAHAMFDDDTSPATRYPVIRGLATAALVRGDLATAHQFSQEGLELAEQTGKADYRIDAISVRAYTTLYYGRLDDCRQCIERCLELYEAEHGHTFRYPVPQDAKTAALALLPTVAWLLGDPLGAEAAIERGLAHVEALGRDFDKALLHAWTSGTRYTQRRYLEGLHHAAIAYQLGATHKFEEWQGVGAMMASLCQSALAPDATALENAQSVAQAFHARGIGLNAAYFLWGMARGHRVAGNGAVASALLTTALGVAAASGEQRMNPEIWLLQSEMETDEARARALCIDAYQLAMSQGAVTNALRALTMLLKRFDSGAREWAESTTLRLDTDAALSRDDGWMRRALQRGEQLAGPQIATPNLTSRDVRPLHDTGAQ